MKQYELRIDTTELKRALDVLSTVVNKKNALPVLGCAKVSYDREHDFFTLVASSGDQFIELQAWRPDGDDESGRKSWMFHDSLMRGDDKTMPLPAFCIRVDDYREAFATLPSMPANCYLQLDETSGAGSLRVSYGKGEFTLPVESAQGFPPVPMVVRKDGEQREGISPICAFAIEAQRLLPTVSNARCCVATDELRPQMCTVCLDVFQDRLVVVSTDGHSLFRQQIDTGTGWLDYGGFAADQSAKLLIPSAALSPLMKSLGAAEHIRLEADTQRIRIADGDGRTALTFTVPEQRYPNYDAVIPQGNPHRVVIDRQELSATLRRIMPFASESSQLCTMKREGDLLYLSAADADFGRRADEHVTIVNPDSSLPEGTTIGFKNSMLQKLLGCCQADEVALAIGSPSTAFLLREDGVESGLTLLCMPMLIN